MSRGFSSSIEETEWWVYVKSKELYKHRGRRSNIKLECACSVENCILSAFVVPGGTRDDRKPFCCHHSEHNRFCGDYDCGVCIKSLILNNDAFKHSCVDYKQHMFLSKGSYKKILFTCTNDKCGKHEYFCKIVDFFYIRPDKQSFLRDIPSGCNHCTRKIVLCSGSCEVCNKKTCNGDFFKKKLIKNNVVVAKWCDKSDSKKVLKRSTKKCLFVCLKCNHKNMYKPYEIMNKSFFVCKTCGYQIPKWTPCDAFDINNYVGCDVCYRISFKSFVDKNKNKISIIHSADLFKSRGSNTKIKYNCLICNKIHIKKVSRITRHNDEYYCPKTKTYVTEEKMKIILRKEFGNENVKNHISFEWCRSLKNRPLIFDFVLFDYIFIELDGLQHFKYIKCFHKTQESFKYAEGKDLLKNKTVINKNFVMIRVYQPNFYSNWKNTRQRLIELIKNIQNKSETSSFYFIQSSSDVVNDKYQEMKDVATIKHKKIKIK